MKSERQKENSQRVDMEEKFKDVKKTINFLEEKLEGYRKKSNE
jgi:hypothetical protein